MRVMIVAGHLRIGGAERAVVNLANGLCGRENTEVCVFLLKKEGVLLGELSPEVKVAEAQTLSSLRPLKFAAKVLSLHLAAKSFKPDVIYTRATSMNLAVGITGRMTGIPTVMAEMNNPAARMEESRYGKRRNYLVLKTARMLSSKVVANSSQLAEATQRTFNLRSKPHVIYNGIDIEQIERQATEEANHPWILDRQTPLVASVGRLVRQKGFETLINAVAILRETSGVRLVIVGDGDIRNELKEQIKRLNLEDAVCLAGEQANPHPFIKAADVYVSSSVFEGFSNSLLEAMSLGIPVVSTDHQFGANEMIEDGKSGLLVPVGDAESMAGEIERVLKDGNLRQNLATGAKERAKNFTIEKAVAEHKKLFREIAGKPT